MLAKFKKVHLPALIIEYMRTVITAKDGKHGLAYGFWLNRILDYVNMVYGQ